MNTKTSGRLAAVRVAKSGDYDDDSVDWKTRYTPHAIYFYYRTKNEIRVYLWVTPENEPIYPADLEGHIIRLTKNARISGGAGIDPRPIGWAFKDVPWWKRSYLVVAADVDGFEFDPGNAVTIVREDGSSNGYPNHCFFDGWDGAIKIPGQDAIQVMWTVNYMKNKSGDDIPPGKSHKFSLRFHSKSGGEKGGKSRRRRDEGDSGTNMGPPVPPP